MAQDSEALGDVVWTSSHTYVSLLPADEFSDDYWENGLLWTYDGQQEFHAESMDCEVLDALHADGDHEAEEALGFGADHVTQHFDWPEWNDAFTREDLVWMAVRVDDLGRRWVVADLDIEAMQDRADAYAADVSAEAGEEWPSYSIADDLVELVPSLEDDEGVDFGWTSGTCSAGGGWNNGYSPVDWTLYDSASRSFMNDMTESHAKSAFVTIMSRTGTGNPWTVSCSGAFVDGDSVLTAAHCVWDDAGAAPVAAKLRAVCRPGNYHPTEHTCFYVANVSVAPAYNGGAVFANDYAVLSIVTGGADQPFYALSTGAEGSLLNDQVRTLGNPGSVSGSSCTANYLTGTGTNLGGSAVFPDALGVWYEAATITEFTSTVIGGRFDSGNGHSGGPFYTISQSGMPVHHGTLKGFHAVPAYIGGARTSPNRTWLLSVM